MPRRSKPPEPGTVEEDTSNSPAGEAQVVLGQVTGIHGIRGWLRVYSYTEPRDNIFTYGSWQLSKQGQVTQSAVVEHRSQGRRLLARIEGCDTREAAESWIGAEISVPESRLAVLDEGDYYWRQLVGLAVVNLAGERIGRVAGLMETGANDVLVVEAKDRSETLIPWLPERVVRAVDLESGVITVDWQADW